VNQTRHARNKLILLPHITYNFLFSFSLFFFSAFFLFSFGRGTMVTLAKKKRKMRQQFAHEKEGLLKRLAAGCDNSPKGNIDVSFINLIVRVSPRI
jgi:Na+/H+ antiporter NhaC